MSYTFILDKPVVTYATRTDLQKRYSVSKATVYRWIKSGALPQPLRLGGTTLRWDVSDLEKWENASRGES